jgi:hypothetical protein
MDPNMGIPWSQSKADVCDEGDEMSLWRFLFPVGSILTIWGVFAYAVLDRPSFGDTEGWGFAILSQTFLPALLIGAPLAIIGSFVERSRLSVFQARFRGMICLAVSAISFILFYVRGG